MEYTYTVTSLRCQFCSAKNHCAECSAEVAAELLSRPGVEAARLDLKERTVTVAGADRDALLDTLEALGLIPE